jgi:hypothetical protein
VLRQIKLVWLLFFLTLTIIPANAQKFAVIGDYGDAGGHELAVANLVKSWSPDFIITVGDNNYEDGLASTIDENIGKYYHDYIKPYLGNTSLYGNGSPDVNRFFPVPGNHDWDASSLPAGDLTPYLEYFTLPNNERYYDFVWGDVHFFMIDSDDREPDGYLETSWPFKLWGADAVFAGHKHNYERLIVDDLVYFVDGLGGKSKQSFRSTITGSEIRYNGDYGAMLVEATSSNISFSFHNTSDTQIDSYEITNPLPVELTYFASTLIGNNVELRWRTETEVNNYYITLLILILIKRRHIITG